jgi:hypothetical protein
MAEEMTSASPRPEEQLEAIHAMLNSGHRGIRVERHSLALWGAAGALLLIVTPRLITPARFPAPWQQATAELVFLAVALALVTALDFSITQRLRRRRDESLPFIQRQMGKVWLLLIGLGLVATFGMHFYGGGAMAYVLWLVLLGMGLFTHGLFSEQFLGWAGGIVISLGVGALALHLPMKGIHWLAVLVFGLGLPTLGFLLRALEKRVLSMRLLFLVAWVTAIALGAFATYRVDRMGDRPGGLTMSLDEFRRGTSPVREQVVSLPRGTVVPIRISLEGDLFAPSGTVSIPVELTRDLELVLINGKLDGRFRAAGGDWKSHVCDISMPAQRLTASLTRGDGFAVEYTGRLATGN